MITLPPLDEALVLLAKVAQLDEPLRGDMLVVDSDIDSLDVFEWVFQLGIETDGAIDDERLVEGLETMTFADLYEVLQAAAALGDAQSETV